MLALVITVSHEHTTIASFLGYIGLKVRNPRIASYFYILLVHIKTKSHDKVYNINLYKPINEEKWKGEKGNKLSE